MQRSRRGPLNISGSKVHSRERDVRKQRARNVPLASADVRGEERLRDELKGAQTLNTINSWQNIGTKENTEYVSYRV